jgi:hypothetical protein
VGPTRPLVLPRGKPAVLLIHPNHRTEINLTAERAYSSRGAGELHSISYTQKPDVAVEVTPSHSPVRIYLFDPKYKLDGIQVRQDRERLRLR